LKSIVKQDECLVNIINIADSCINLGHWLNYFKYLSTMIIPKPNKMSYDQPKSFYPIVLLNTLGKLIEKVIMERIQFTVVSNDFIHLSQLGGLKFMNVLETLSTFSAMLISLRMFPRTFWVGQSVVLLTWHHPMLFISLLIG